MLRTLKLLLPALIPSWRFFDEIAPSPRIEYTLLKNKNDTPQNWQEFRPRPAHLSHAQMLKRMIWNPHWNENLFLMSCAERMIQGQKDHSARIIIERMREDFKESRAYRYFQFRLVFIARGKSAVEKHILYTSAAEQLFEEERS